MLTFVYFIFSAKKIFQHCNIGVTEIVQEEPRAVCWAATELPTFPETALFVTTVQYAGSGLYHYLFMCMLRRKNVFKYVR